MGVKVKQWKGAWWVFVNHEGRRKAKRIGDGDTGKRAAKKVAIKVQAKLALGEPIALHQPDAAMPTVKDYLTEWVKVYAEAHCKHSTASGYRGVIEHHLIPAFGDYRLHEVTRSEIKRLIASLVAQGRKKRTIHNVLTPLKEAYQHAIDDGLVTVNPVAKMGRALQAEQSADAHINPLTTEEVRVLLHMTRERTPLFYPLFLCAVRTGLREGELIGLRWNDIDFHGDFIEVRHNVVRRKETTTKTRKIRRVDLSPQLKAELERLRETRQLDASMKGDTTPPDWVFLTPQRNRMTNEVLRKAFYAQLAAAGLRKVRFHDLRHTFASLLIQQGANVKYIQQQLGHSSISITLDVYSHLFHGDHRHHVHRLDDPQATELNIVSSESESATSAQPTPAVETTRISEVVGI
ncbi:MAG: tyrosine-type recombinase/integrase [Nitrospira sp.]